MEHEKNVPDVSLAKLQSNSSKARQASELILESEERFRNLAEASLQGIFIHREFKPLYVNQSWAEIFGFSSVEEAMAVESLLDMVPKKVAKDLEKIAKARSKGDSVPNRYMFEAKRIDGQSIWLDLSGRLINWDGEPAFLATVVDITDLKVAQEELSRHRDSLEELVVERTRNLLESEARMSSLVKIAPEGVISLDSELNIALFNRGAERIFGYAVSEIEGHPLNDLIPLRFRAYHGSYVRKFVDSDEDTLLMGKRTEVVGLRKDGSEFPAEASVSKIQTNDQIMFSVIIHDISERKESERKLVLAQQTAEIANRTKSEFLANMSHELRTPLNAVIGFSDALINGIYGPVEDPQKERIGDIQKAGRHLLNLINDVLDLSKVESGKFEPVFETINLESAVESAFRLVALRAAEANVKMSMEVLPGGLTLHADERLLKQMLINLLSNAVKFTPSGGAVTIAVSQKITGELQIEVRDDGYGMKNEDIPKALSTFGQIDESWSKKSEGTGLGLPLVKSFMKLHDGDLEIESEFGKGTVARLVFPVSEAR